MADPNSEDTRTQEQKRADRKYAGQRQQEFLRDVATGMTEEQLREKGYGGFHLNNLALAEEFGPGAIYSGLNIDILGRQVFDPTYGWFDDKGQYQRGQWRPMSEYPGLYEGIVNYQAQRDSPQNAGWKEAYPNAYQGYLRKQEIDNAVRGGHLTWDPATRTYFNIGRGDPNNPATWQRLDEFGRPIGAAGFGMPAGMGGSGSGSSGYGSGSGFSLPGGGTIPGFGALPSGFSGSGGSSSGGLQDLLLDNSLTNTLSKFYGWPEVPGSGGQTRRPGFSKALPGGGLLWGDTDPGPFGGSRSASTPSTSGFGGPSLLDVVGSSGASKSLRRVKDVASDFEGAKPVASLGGYNPGGGARRPRGPFACPT